MIEKVIELLAETHCPSQIGLPEFSKCDGKRDCRECWRVAISKEKAKSKKGD